MKHVRVGMRRSKRHGEAWVEGPAAWVEIDGVRLDGWGVGSVAHEARGDDFGIVTLKFCASYETVDAEEPERSA